MRSFTLLLLFPLFLSLAKAQNNEGIIIFEDKFNIHRTLPPEMEGMKENIPEFRTASFEMYFNAKETIYKPKELTEEEKEQHQEYRGRHNRGSHWRMRMGRGKGRSSVYTDIENKTTLSSEDLFGKMFLVSGTVKSYDWKVTGKQKQVGSYLCMEAIHSDTSGTTVVWFTPMIPVQAGPNSFAGLPGMILHVDINDGERLITAIDVKLETLEEGTIVTPTEGKPISQEEYEKLRQEKMEEMKSEYGGRGRIMIHH